MEITGSALTALFVGLIWTLIRVVEFFIRKYGKVKEEEEATALAKSLTLTQTNQFKEISEEIQRINHNGCLATEAKADILEKICENSNKLFELHNVFNENHVPAWYVPSDLIELVRKSNNCLNNLERNLDLANNDRKAEQHITIDRLSDLIGSQKTMTERLSDLIVILNKFNQN